MVRLCSYFRCLRSQQRRWGLLITDVDTRGDIARSTCSMFRGQYLVTARS